MPGVQAALIVEFRSRTGLAQLFQTVQRVAFLVRQG